MEEKINKRPRSAAIIVRDGKLATMYREFAGRKYHTLPGGKIEEGESEEVCVVREALEEFGIVIKPIRKLYDYEDEKSCEHFYLCEWVSGEFGSGTGEEFQPGRDRGIYKPMFIKISDIPKLTLYPSEVAKALFEDYKKFGSNFDAKPKKLVGHRV